MIKGINRQIIEIGETGNLYFEKAFLFVRPGVEDVDDNHLKTEAKQMIKRWSIPSKLNRYQKPIKRFVKTRKILNALFWSGMGAITFALLEYLFF